ncbi:MAG: winged helix-turn-helix domain-containing protein, partial [Acidobacteriota bacterium]|nr:winged helix-turn-helix domain-containing protein [Acidobacteriota bacterium]
MNEADSPIYRFAEMEIDPQRQSLRIAGQEHYLRPKTFRVLVYLVQQRQRLVTKDELINQVWDGAAVSDDTLVQCIVDIRKALGDDSRNPRFVKTLPKIGYHFISPVEELRPKDTATAQSSNQSGAVEFEEISSFEVEIEEEDDGLPMAVPASAQALPAPPRRFSRRLVVAISLALVAAMALGWAALSGRRSEAEVKLPQVPGKRALAVLFFENRSGAPELDWLREGLADMLIANFSRSPKLSVLSRQQLAVLLDRIGHRRTEQVQLEEALEIARKTQAEVIALGSFAQLGETVRLDVQLHDARTGQLLTTESMIADKPEDILTQVDLLSFKLAGHLGVSLTDRQLVGRLADVTTGNLKAYRYYSLAMEKIHAFHSAEAVGLLEKAVALDDQFAMAYARLGSVYLHGGFSDQFDKAKRYLEQAFRLTHRLTERDRLYINFWYAAADGDESLLRVLREIINQYPRDVEAYYHLSYALRNEARLEEAVEVIKQGLIVDAEAPELHNRLGFCYTELGRYDEARAAHERYVQLAPLDANAYDSLGMTYNEMGRLADALAAFDRALALNPGFGLAALHKGD